MTAQPTDDGMPGLNGGRTGSTTDAGPRELNPFQLFEPGGIGRTRDGAFTDFSPRAERLSDVPEPAPADLEAITESGDDDLQGTLFENPTEIEAAALAAAIEADDQAKLPTGVKSGKAAPA